MVPIALLEEGHGFLLTAILTLMRVSPVLHPLTVPPNYPQMWGIGETCFGKIMLPFFCKIGFFAR